MVRKTLLVAAMIACTFLGMYLARAAPRLYAIQGRNDFGLTCRGRVVDVIDGDTLEVEFRPRMRVRLIGIDAPETRTKDAAEKEAGKASKNHLAFYAQGQHVVVTIPWGESANRIDHVTTFGRVLGHVYLTGPPRQSLGELQLKYGHAVQSVH